MSQPNQNAALYFVDRHRDDAAKNKPAFIESGANGRRLTYAALAAQSDQIADLLARHNIGREDRALMLVHDTIEFPIIFWGALKAGIIPIPLNTMLPGDIYAAILADCRPRALFISALPLTDDRPAFDRSPKNPRCVRYRRCHPAIPKFPIRTRPKPSPFPHPRQP